MSAKIFPAAREPSLAEITHRGLELFLDHYPQVAPPAEPWHLPRVDGTGIKVPLKQLVQITATDQSTRSLPH